MDILWLGQSGYFRDPIQQACVLHEVWMARKGSLISSAQAGDRFHK